MLAVKSNHTMFFARKKNYFLKESESESTLDGII